jgi:iron complex outermembrane receptor protein
VPVLPARDFTGNRIDRTPRFSYSLGVSQNVPAPGGSLEFAVETNYSGKYYYDAQNEPLFSTDAFQTVDARVAWLFESPAFEITAFVRNALDETHAASGYSTDFGYLEQASPPRTYGVRLKYTFSH